MSAASISATSTLNSDNTCADWVAWHKNLVAAYGKDQADLIWMNAYTSLSFWSLDKSFCKYNSSFATYIADNNLDAGNVISGTTNKAEKVWNNVTNSVSNIFGAGESLTKALKWIIPVVLIIVVGIIIFIVVKNSRQIVAMV